MKVLVISVTCGQGHNSTAKALIRRLEEKGVECCLLDAFEHISKTLAKAIDDGYQLSTKYIAKPYAKIYRFAEQRKKNSDDESGVKLLNSLLASRLRKHIETYDPDVIVATHSIAAAIIDVLKEKKVIRSINIGIVTDFTVHPFWEEALHFDYIVTPSELLDHQMLHKGFTKKQILPFGIPINPKFSENRSDKAQVLRSLGLDPEKLTILVMSGSMGFGNIRHVVAKLDTVQADFQAIVVCGNNAEAKKEVDEMRKAKKFVTFGYVTNVDELMTAADCIVTKPGGLTTSEALAMQLPLILINPIPGQEDRNLEFLLNNGAAMAVSDTCPIDEVLFQISQNPERIELMEKSIAFLRKPDSTERLSSFIAGLETPLRHEEISGAVGEEAAALPEA